MDDFTNIFLSHVSALACWATVGHHGLTGRTKTDVRAPSTSVRNARTIRSLGILESKFMSKIEKPLDLLVPTMNAKFRSRLSTCHLCVNELPPHSFRRLTSNVFVSSPELTFMQMGTILTDTQLALVGMMLCGSFAVAPNEDRTLIRRQPLATVESLQAYAYAPHGVRGATRARSSLPMVVEGSRSPKESELLLLMCLPDERGGYCLERPELNRKLSLSPQAASIAGTYELTPDLCWHDAGVLMEFDSWENHHRPDQLANDDLRVQAFRKDGWEVVTLRTVNMENLARFDTIVRNVLAPALGASVPHKNTAFVRRRDHLRKELSGFDPYVPSGVARATLRKLEAERKEHTRTG